MQSLLQTQPWADLKVSQGWKSHPITLDASTKDKATDAQTISILERDLAFKKTMLYAPEATLETPNATAKTLQELAKKVRKEGPNAIFFRLELLMPLGESKQSITAQLTKAGYRKSFEEVQPEHRQWIAIASDETTIMAAMKEKGRYNVRLAEKRGVTTRISTDTKDVEVFYQLFKYTAERDRFTIRSLGYFHALCAMLFENKLGELIIAEKDGEPLAALILTYHDGLASYLYGASSNNQRNLMAPYAAHMAAIRAAKQQGCTTYDLLQIEPPDAIDHHYANLTRFKQQFGGERVDLVGSWDYIYQPLWYQAFKLAEQARRH